jgi:hypothetical protein
MFSIYHFFAHLSRHRDDLKSVQKLDDFPYDIELLSCRNVGKFPDMAIRINPEEQAGLTGGELIELKDSRSYTVSSFNSTIPTAQKPIEALVSGKSNHIRQQMEQAGDDIFALPIRDVFYLIRGKQKGNVKICLVHGSFFETIQVDELIRQAFGQVVNERLLDMQKTINPELQTFLTELFFEQKNFSRVRDVKKASVKLRFRVMTEVKAEGNILNTVRYPQIGDNTLNLVLPLHLFSHETIFACIHQAFGKQELLQARHLTLKHPLNGEFFVLQFGV